MLGKLALLLAVVLLSEGNNFPDDLYPKELTKAEYRSQCPNEFHKLSLCIPKYEDCVGRMAEPKECNKEFQKCTEIVVDVPIDDDFVLDDCSNFTTNAVFYVWTHGASIQKTVVKNKRIPVVEAVQKRLEPMRNAFLWVEKECVIKARLKNEMNRLLEANNVTNDLMNATMPYFTFHLVEKSMMRTKRCRSAIESLEKVMETVDATSAEHLHIPYEFWHMGSAFGPIGKVPFRVIADEACGKATLELNHHSVIHVNCYDQQLPRKECDQKYIEDIEGVLSTMDATKLNCKMFTDLIKILLPIRAAQFYKEASQFVTESKLLTVGDKLNQGFSGFINGSLTRRDTKNTFVKLEASQNTSFRLLDYYEQVSAECGASRRSAGIVSSCGFLYEYCTHFVQSGCATRLSICLNTIGSMTKSCQTAMSLISNFLWPTEKLTTSPVDQKRVDDSWGFVGWMLMFATCAIIIIISATTALVFIFKMRSANSSKNNIDNNGNMGEEGTRIIETEDDVPDINNEIRVVPDDDDHIHDEYRSLN